VARILPPTLLVSEQEEEPVLVEVWEAEEGEALVWEAVLVLQEEVVMEAVL